MDCLAAADLLVYFINRLPASHENRRARKFSFRDGDSTVARGKERPLLLILPSRIVSGKAAIVASFAFGGKSPRGKQFSFFSLPSALAHCG